MRPVGSKYLLEEPLGRGATGTVWRARVRDGAAATAEGLAAHPGEAVAIKVLREDLASDPDIVTRFLRERSVLLRLTHPNIVRVRDLVVEGDLLALVMDLVDGPDLHRYLRDNGPFTPVAAALLTAGVADALAASHADNVVHRDLKPANVLLVTSGGDDASRMHPMLTDFGIARLADSPGLTRTHEFVGTPAYIAPEAAEGRPQTSAVDIYGAGIMLYELVTGNPPFHGDSPLAILHQHITAEPQRPSSVPEPLWTVIERCLRKDPGARPSAQTLARALRVVADGVGAYASPAAAAQAMGVAALLAPDPSPTQVPLAGGADAAATQVLPDRPAAAPEGTTQVLPSGTPPGQGDPGAATRLLPPTGDSANEQTPEQPPGAHPWQTQLQAARSRNEQTQVRPLDPAEDPLRRRPRRRPPAAQPPAAAPQYRQADQRQQQPYAPYQPAQQQYYPQRQPQPPAAPRRPEPEPAPRRERRPRAERRPARIPGASCLRSCLLTILIIVVIWVLVWNFTPLPDWIAQGKSWWEATRGWIGDVGGWIKDVTGIADNAQKAGQ